LNRRRKIRGKSEQSGIALLLAIFVLLLVCVVGIAMLAASGTETSLSGNYRSSTATYYAALSGLEEGRARLLPQYPSPNSLNPTYIPAYGSGSILPLGQAIYIRNPVGGETVDPTALGNPDQYPDTEWASEFPNFNPPTVQFVPSVTNLAGSPNAAYKWVRINALSEWAIQINVNNIGVTPNKTQPIYFDGTNLTRNVAPYQALGVTALAALPDGSRKLLRYVVGPITLQLPIVAALTMEGPGGGGNIVTFNQPSVSPYTFQVNGNDQAIGSNPGPGIACTAQPPIPAVGVLNVDDWNYLHNIDLAAPSPGQYIGEYGTATTPSVSSPYVHPQNSNFDLTDPVSLTNLVQLIQNTADTVVTGPATEGNMPAAMSFSNPQTVVVNGDLTLNGYTGYGLLLVTGKLTYSGDSGWKGIVLVIGQGVVEETGSANTGEIDGAVFVARVVSGAGGTGLGPSSYTAANPGGKGIYYNSCWIAKAQRPISYKILSFREIPYP
jgi:hypothetical protein